MHLWPVRAARYSIIVVLPTLVGPCRSTGATPEATAAARSRMLASTVGVMTKRVVPVTASRSAQSMQSRGPVRSQNGPTKTHWVLPPLPPGRDGGAVSSLPPTTLKLSFKNCHMCRLLASPNNVWKFNRNPSNSARFNGRKLSPRKDFAASSDRVKERSEYLARCPALSTKIVSEEAREPKYTSTISFTGALLIFCKYLATTLARSAGSVISFTYISVNRPRREAGNSFLPMSVGGFMAANTRKSGWRTTGSTSPLSVRHNDWPSNIPAIPCSVSGVARLISSSKTQCPARMASTSRPSTKAKAKPNSIRGKLTSNRFTRWLSSLHAADSFAMRAELACC